FLPLQRCAQTLPTYYRSFFIAALQGGRDETGQGHLLPIERSRRGSGRARNVASLLRYLQGGGSGAEGSTGGTSRVRVRLPNGLLLIAGSFVQFDVGAPRIVNKCERNERGLRVRPIELDSVRLQIIQERL